MHVVVNTRFVGLWSSDEGREEAVLVGHGRDDPVRLRLKENGNSNIGWVVKTIDIDYRARATQGGEDACAWATTAATAAAGMCRPSWMYQDDSGHNC